MLVRAAAIDVFAEPPVPVPAWTTDLSEMKVPDAPVSGMIHGRRFTADKVKLRDFGLKLQHGREEFGDLSVTITLDARRTDLFEGATYRSGPGSDDRRRGSFRSVCVTENAGPSSQCETHDYAMSLELSKLTNGVVIGKLYLCLLDEKHSVIAGTFKVGGPGTQQLTRTEIVGDIAYQGREKEFYLCVGCLGRNQAGKLENPTTSFPFERHPPDGTADSTYAEEVARRITNLGVDFNQQIYHSHINRPPGHYLVFITGPPANAPADFFQWPKGKGEGYYDWKSVEVKDDRSKVVADLSVDPQKLGALAVTASPSGEATRATNLICVPLDASGKLPLPEALLRGRCLIWQSRYFNE